MWGIDLLEKYSSTITVETFFTSFCRSDSLDNIYDYKLLQHDLSAGL